MPLTTPNTILYKPAGGLHEHYDEGRVKAGSSILPGMLIDTYSDGTKLPHATAGGYAIKEVAIEDGFGPGPTYGIGKKLTDPYVAGALVRYIALEGGEQVYMLFKDGEVAAIGTLLSSNGDGKLQAIAGSEVALFRAEEALSPSGSDLYLLCTAL